MVFDDAQIISSPLPNIHLCLFPSPHSHFLSSRLNCLLFLAGGHINPAVSFAMCAFGRMEWFRFPFYVGAQFLGAFAGAATVFGIYYGEY